MKKIFIVLALTCYSLLFLFADEKITIVQDDLKIIRNAIDNYIYDGGNYGPPKALSMKKLIEMLVPKFAEKLPLKDPWGSNYRYRQGSSYAVVSCGPDKSINTQDDISIDMDGKIGGKIGEVKESY
jgi:hypothetical protein